MYKIHIVVSQVIKHHYGAYNKDTVAASTEDPLLKEKENDSVM